MRPLLALFALLAALPLSAEILNVIEFDPPLPDSSMPVQVHLAGINNDSCVPSKPRAYVNGHAITITVETPSAGAGTSPSTSPPTIDSAARCASTTSTARRGA